MTIFRPLGIAALLITAIGGGYYAYVNLLNPEAVTTSIAIQAPVSEAVYGTGTVEPERWAKIVGYANERGVTLPASAEFGRSAKSCPP